MHGFGGRPIGTLAVVLIVLTASALVGGTISAGRLPTSPTATAAPPSAPHAVPPSTPSAVSSAVIRAHSIEGRLAELGAPLRDVHLPNLGAEGVHRMGQVGLTYPSAPAPMGVADLGLRNDSGTLVPYSLNTTSAAGAINFSSAQAVGVADDGPDMFGVQLNSVLTGVDLFGNTSYQFWTQNFVSYTSSSGELSFGDNIWNFSDRSGLISPNVFYAYGPNGTLYAPDLYLAVGPTFTVHYPFRVTFYLNSSVVDDRQALFFNYSVASNSTHASGSFDDVVFNSTPSATIAPAEFQVNGYAYDPIGLVNDIELVVVGNDDGDTTTFFAMQAALVIAYWNATVGAYRTVPSAFDVGADTGETSDGVAVVYLAPPAGPSGIAFMTVGPSFLYGLWNVSNDPGYRTVIDHLRPNNAFVFVNPGTAYLPSEAQWVPTITSAPASAFLLPNEGSYFLETMLTDYVPTGATISLPPNGTTTFGTTLVASSAEGVYTPMIIWGNAGFASLAVAGSGVDGAPYVLPNDQTEPLAPVFAQWNDFQFPVFPGLLLVNTTAWVTVTPPSLAVTIPPWVESPPAAYGMPNSTDLEIQLWGASNVSLVNAPAISGWLSADLSPYPEGEVLLWNSSGNLIAGNTFYDQGTGLGLYGGSNNTVWGNWFYATPIPSGNPGAFMNPGAATVGIYESESGDRIYNNYLDVPVPALTPTMDPLLCQIECEPSSYLDVWNVTPAPAAAWTGVLGWNLTGSIIGTTYQAGNYWSNYGSPSDPFGVLPYTDGGLISNGGDFDPLVFATVAPVEFLAEGLANGTAWNVTADGVTTSSTSNSLVVWLSNGTFPIQVGVSGAYQVLAPANVTVPASGGPVTIRFVPIATFSAYESGLVPGWTWTVSLTGAGGNFSENASGPSVRIPVPSGNYSFAFTSYGYLAAPSNGTVEIESSGVGLGVEFTLLVGLTFEEQGLPVGTAWTVSLLQGSSSTFLTSVGPFVGFTALTAIAGPFTYVVTAAGYNATPAVGNGTYPALAPVTVVFSPVAGVLEGSIVPTNATLYVDGQAVAVKGGYFTTSLLPGVHAVLATSAGYLPYYNNVTVASGGITSLSVSMVPVPAPSPSSSSSSSPTWAWVVAGVFAALTAVFLALALYFRGRPRAPPPPLTPVPSPVAASAEPPSAPPWQEDEVRPGESEGVGPGTP